MGKLTDRQILNFRHPADKGRHTDGDGLFLDVKPTYKPRRSGHVRGQKKGRNCWHLYGDRFQEEAPPPT